LDQGQLALFIILILIKKVVGVCGVILYPNATFRATLKVTHLLLFSNVTRVAAIVMDEHCSNIFFFSIFSPCRIMNVSFYLFFFHPIWSLFVYLFHFNHFLIKKFSNFVICLLVSFYFYIEFSPFSFISSLFFTIFMIKFYF
jgi:hypothetical protein